VGKIRALHATNYYWFFNWQNTLGTEHLAAEYG